MRRDQRGQLGGIEAVAFGLLILIGGVLLIANSWAVVDAKLAARTAARDAARTFATAPTSDPADAVAAADHTARDTLAQLGWQNRGISVTVTGPGFKRCAIVSFVITIPVRVFRLPFLPLGPPSFHVSAHHTERVDPYRSGVPGSTTRPCVGGEAP